MLTYLLQVTVCLAAFYTLYAFLFRNETFFGTNRIYLLVTLWLSTGIPMLLYLPEGIVLTGSDTIFTQTFEPIVIGFQDAGSTLERAHTSSLLMRLLKMTYVTGILALSIRFLFQLFVILKAYRSGERIALPGGRTLIYSGSPHLPYSFFSMIFLSRQDKLTTRELEEILAHETAHASAYHSIDVLLMEIACIIFWPSPMIYLYRKSLRGVHEYLADAAVLRQSTFAHYGELLISQATNRLQNALANHFFQSQLKQRFIMMTRDKSRRIALLKYTMLIPILLIVLTLFAFRKSENAIVDDMIPAMHQDSIPGEVFKVVEVMPRFPGCEDSGLADRDLHDCSMNKLLEHVYANLQYPVALKEKNIQGRVISQFIVRRDGSITDVSIIRSLDRTADAEVVRVIRTMPPWIPGYQAGKAVDVQFTLPVVFKIFEEQKPSESDGDKTVYTIVEEMPRFPGCETSGLTGDALYACATKKLIEYVAANLRYPAEARSQNIEGSSVVQFTIKKDGTISDARIVQSIGFGTDEEVLRIINSMPAWHPGDQSGSAQDVKMSLPIIFSLSPKTTPGAEGSSRASLVLEVFPSPAEDLLNYTLSGFSGQGELSTQLVSSTGQIVYTANVVVGSNTDKSSYSGQIPTKDIAPGSYTLAVSFGKDVASKIVVIRRE